MKFEVVVEEDFPHPIEKVWTAMTERKALGEWLLETDNFRPEVGCKFEMYCTNDDGTRDVYRMEVLELEAPRRMLWSWVLSGNESQGLTEVEFVLNEIEGGTRVTVRHRGDRDREMLERFRSGWPFKLRAMADFLKASG